MRILHVSSEHPPQKVFGLGRYVSDLSRHLALQGHEVHVLTNSIGGPEQDVIDQGVCVHRVEYPPPPKAPSAGGPVMSFNLHLQQRAHALGKAKLGNPEVVVSHDWLTALAGHRIARRFGVTHAWTVHDTVFGKRSCKPAEPEDPLTFHLESWATKSADLVLVNSRAIGDEIAGPYKGDRRRMALLHPGIDPAQFTGEVAPERLSAFRSVFALPEEFLVTYSGRLDPEKGIDTLIEAFSILRKLIPRSRLAMAGQGRLQPQIEDHVRKLGLEREVRLYGYLQGPVLAHFYRVSDVHICPSHYEPFGLVAAEAMASGTPVVVSDTGGLTDIVSSPAVGRTFPPRDAEALAEILGALAQDEHLRVKLGEAGKAHILKGFSWSTLAGRAHEIYASLLTSARRSA